MLYRSCTCQLLALQLSASVAKHGVFSGSSTVSESMHKSVWDIDLGNAREVLASSASPTPERAGPP